MKIIVKMLSPFEPALFSMCGSPSAVSIVYGMLMNIIALPEVFFFCKMES